MKVETTSRGKEGLMDADFANKNVLNPLNNIFTMTVTPDGIAQFEFSEGGSKLAFRLSLIDCIFCVAGNQLKTGQVLGIITGDYTP